MEAGGGRHVASSASSAQDSHTGRRLHVGAVAVDLVPYVVVEGLALGQLHGEGLDVAVAADLQAQLAAGRQLAEHLAQLVGAVDIQAVDRQHHIIDLEADLAGGRVVVDESDDSAARLLELEGLRSVSVYVRNRHAKVTLRAGVHEQRLRIFKDLDYGLALCARSMRRGQPSGESNQGNCIPTQFSVRPQKVLHFSFSSRMPTPLRTLFCPGALAGWAGRSQSLYWISGTRLNTCRETFRIWGLSSEFETEYKTCLTLVSASTGSSRLMALERTWASLSLSSASSTALRTRTSSAT